MPSSAIETVPYIVEFLRYTVPHPKRVLDVGVGFGKMGFLLREYLEAREGRFAKKQWRIQLIGIEIYKPYISSLQRSLYDKIIFGDVFKVIPKLRGFDVAILSDVLEHFEKKQGLILLDELVDRSSYVLVATPYGWKPQSAVGKNKHEAHKSGWLPKDFSRYLIVKKAVVSRLRMNEKVMILLLKKR